MRSHMVIQSALAAITVAGFVMLMSGAVYAESSTTGPANLLPTASTSAQVPVVLAGGGGGGGGSGKGGSGMSGGKVHKGSSNWHHRRHHHRNSVYYGSDPCWSCRWNGYRKICYYTCGDEPY